jgi:hypothetical protein
MSEVNRWVDISRRLNLNGIDAANLQEDQNDMWKRIAGNLKPVPKSTQWTAHKVEYAWYRGVSQGCSFTLEPVLWTEELSQHVNQIKLGVQAFS